MSAEERGPRGPTRASGPDANGAPEEPETTGYEESGEEFAQADPDVLLDVPRVNIEELSLEVEELEARVSLRTRLADLLEIDVGIDVSLGQVKLETKGVEAEARLKARLDTVHAMIERTLASVDANPRLVEDLANMSRSASRGAEGAPSLPPADGSGGAREAGAPQATEAAENKARELGVDLSSLEGTGSGGRVILRDVQRAARG